MHKVLYAPILAKILEEDREERRQERERYQERIDNGSFLLPFRATATIQGIVTEEGRIGAELAIVPKNITGELSRIAALAYSAKVAFRTQKDTGTFLFVYKCRECGFAFLHPFHVLDLSWMRTSNHIYAFAVAHQQEAIETHKDFKEDCRSVPTCAFTPEGSPSPAPASPSR